MVRPLMSVPFVVTFLYHKSHWQHIKSISVSVLPVFVLLQKARNDKIKDKNTYMFTSLRISPKPVSSEQPVVR